MEADDQAAYLARLKAEIAKPAYSGLTPQAIADKLNSPVVTTDAPTVKLPVSTEIARGVMFAESPTWPELKAAALTAGPIQGVAAVVYDAVTLQTTLATDNPDMYTVINTALTDLVTAGVMTQAVKDLLMALADPPSVTTETHPVALDMAIGIPGAPNSVTTDLITEAQA